MLQNETWKESRQQELPVQIEDKEVPLFKKMLTYMVTQCINVLYMTGIFSTTDPSKFPLKKWFLFWLFPTIMVFFLLKMHVERFLERILTKTTSLHFWKLSNSTLATSWMQNVQVESPSFMSLTHSLLQNIWQRTLERCWWRTSWCLWILKLGMKCWR